MIVLVASDELPETAILAKLADVLVGNTNEACHCFGVAPC